ncbi:MAG: hypothetical protein L3J35_10030 [Bacteroidales bacterium]|nr:hypothetical protein [Bacteroidales bacterium]
MSIKSISLKFSIDCSNCGDTLPINKAAEKILCNTCGEVSFAPVELWQKLVTENLVEATTFKPETDSFSNGIIGGFGNFSMIFGNMIPRCADGCGTLWPLKDVLEVAETGHNEFNCTVCGKIWSVRKPPEWFNKVIPNVKFLIGEESPGDSGTKIEDTKEGICIWCYHCGGQLPLDGSSRKVNCQFCGNDLLVPDEIWSRLNPVTVARPWFIILDIGENVALLPYDIDDFIDLEALPSGNTILLWEQDSAGRLGLSDKSGGLRWQTKKFDISDYARLLYDKHNNRIWVIDRDEHLVFIFNSVTGALISKIENEEENENLITAYDHEGIAICTDGSVIIYRRWLDLEENYEFYEYTPRRFDIDGNRIPLWEGYEDLKLKFRDEVSFKQLADQPTMFPDEAWLMGGPDNTLYVLDREKGKFARFDRKGKLLEIVKPKLKGVDKIQDCGVTKDGTIYVLFDHKNDIGNENYSHVGKISPDGSFKILAGPLNDINNFPLGTDMERMAVGETGEMHLCDQDFNNFRILASDGSQVWRSPGTINEDEDLLEELEEAKKSKDDYL